MEILVYLPRGGGDEDRNSSPTDGSNDYEREHSPAPSAVRPAIIYGVRMKRCPHFVMRLYCAPSWPNCDAQE